MLRFFLCFRALFLFVVISCFVSPVFGVVNYITNNCFDSIDSACDATRRQCEAVLGKVFTGWYDTNGDYIENLTTYNGDATAGCKNGKFAVVVKAPANGKFAVKREFTGSIDIDWGDNSAVETSTNKDNTGKTTNHTYATPGHVYVVVLDNVSATNYAGYSGYANVSFPTNPSAILNIHGSLGALFPTNTSFSANNQSPRFYNAFASATNLVGPLPPNLFRGITVKVSGMFAQTFNGCSSLSGYLPPTVFDSNLTTNAQSYSNNIFNGTALVTSCPADTYEVATSISKSYLNNKVACELCPLHATALAGSTSIGACVCPTNSTLNNSQTECVCDSGYTWDGSVCSASGCAVMYNGVCAVDCSDANMNVLKTASGLTIPVWGNKLTTPAIRFVIFLWQQGQPHLAVYVWNIMARYIMLLWFSSYSPIFFAACKVLIKVSAAI